MSAIGGKADIEAKLLTKHEARRSRVGYARSLGKSLDAGSAGAIAEAALKQNTAPRVN